MNLEQLKHFPQTLLNNLGETVSQELRKLTPIDMPAFQEYIGRIGAEYNPLKPVEEL